MEKGINLTILVSKDANVKILNSIGIIGIDRAKCGNINSGGISHKIRFFPGTDPESSIWIDFEIEGKRYYWSLNVKFQPGEQYNVQIGIGPDKLIVYLITQETNGKWLTLLVGKDHYKLKE